jgi:hypothetical protein
MYSRYRSFVLRHLTFYLLGYGLLLIIGTLLTTASQMSGLNFAGNVLQYLGGVCLITVINFSAGSFFRKLILVAGIVMTMVEVKVGGIFVVHPTFSILGMFLVAAGIVTMLLVLFSQAKPNTSGRQAYPRR